MKCTAPEEFRYFVINTPGKWREGLTDAVLIDPEGHLSLAPMVNAGLLGENVRVTGLAFDRNGNLFLIDASDCQLYRFTPGTQQIHRLECLERCDAKEGECACLDGSRRSSQVRGLFGCGSEYAEFRFIENGIASGGLAFGKATLYVADPFNHRVQAFYLPGFQIRFVMGKQSHCSPVSGTGEGEFNRPKDVVTDSKGSLYVLDYGNRRIQKFDRRGRFLQFLGTDEPHALKQPESLAIDRDDFVYVVDSEKLTVERFDPNGEWQNAPITWPTAIPEGFREISGPTQPSAIAVSKTRIIYVGERGNGSDLGIHQFDQTGKYLGRFGRFSGGCFKLVVDRNERVYASCGPEGNVLFFADGHFEKQGIYYSRVFDSTIEACQWHRLALDIQPAESSQVQVFFRTSDEKFYLSDRDENLEWRPLFITPHDSVAVTDALFRQVAGRYLQLRFDFTGDGFHSHKVNLAQIYFERLSYLRYLPATYQEDEKGRDFLERFLSIFESMSFEVEQEIAGVSQYFDSEAVSGEFLEWLGAWIAILQDHNWAEKKRREFLRKAFQLYQLRGTTQGLRSIVELFTEGKTRIIEHYGLQTPLVVGAKNSSLGRSTVLAKGYTKRLVLEESSRIGEFALIETDEPLEKPFEAGAFDFTFLVETSRVENETQMLALRRLIDEEKPAHTRCFLRTGGEQMQLGVHALLELDTLSKGFNTARLGIDARVGRTLFLGTKFRRRGVIGMRSTIGVDTLLH